MRPHLQARASAAARETVALTPAGLRAAKVSVDAAEQAVADALWQRPVRGLYIPHARDLTPIELALAGSAWLNQPCVVTGLVALHLLEMRWLPTAQDVHLLVEDRVRRASRGPFVVQRTGQWSSLESTTRFGLRWASPERAIIDAACRATSLRDARDIVLGGVADGHAAASELEQVLSVRRRNGSALARRAIADAGRGCASPPEAELVDALVGGGEPFLVNPELRVGGVLLGYPDIWLVARNVGGEVESRERHEDGEQEESTYDRHERFAEHGAPLVHLGVGRIRRDVDAAAGYLLRRGAELAGSRPPGLEVIPRGPVLR